MKSASILADSPDQSMGISDHIMTGKTHTHSDAQRNFLIKYNGTKLRCCCFNTEAVSIDGCCFNMLLYACIMLCARSDDVFV